MIIVQGKNNKTNSVNPHSQIIAQNPSSSVPRLQCNKMALDLQFNINIPTLSYQN